MNAWVVVAVLLLGGALALAPIVWSWLDPSSPARSRERLLAVLSTWNGIRDFVAEVAVRSAEGETQARVLFLVPANLRLDVLAPSSLAGEVFTVRPVAEEWLFVHYRPKVDLGIEARIPAKDLETSLKLPSPAQLWDGLRQGRISVTYLPASLNDANLGDEFDLHGLPGQFPRIVLRVDPASQLPREVNLYTDPRLPPTIKIEVRQLTVNTGLELRDVLRLDPSPSRWLSPTPAPEG